MGELTECRQLVPRLQERVKFTNEEAEALRAKVEELGKMAEKRKTMIDEMAIQSQTEADNFKVEMATLRDRQKAELQSCEEKNKELKKRVVDFDKMLNSLSEAKGQITSLENANGWFERRLAEADDQLEASKHELE